jgi:arginine metabolism regulation protein II
MEGSFAGFFAHLRGCHQARNLRMLQSPQADASQSRVRQLEITSMFMDTIANTTATDWAEPRHFPRYSDQPVLLDVPFEATDTFLEHSYGITTSIASMIYSTNKIWLYTQGLTDIGPLSTEEINDSLAHLAEQLERWAPSSEDYTSFSGADAVQMPLMKSLSTAIYYATRIYFHSCFRSNSTHQNSMPTRLSDLTLMALEQSESVRGPTIKAGAPLSWPAFIAACEAPPALRGRWTHYWQTLLKHQIGTQQAAWEIVQEVWRRKEVDEQGGLVMGYEAPVLATLDSCQVVEPAWISVIRDFGITIFAY